MPNLNQAIQSIIKDTLESQKLTNICYGKVSSISPVSVRLDNDILLTQRFLIVPEHLIEKTIIFDDTEYVTQPGLAVGEKVALLRNSGGQSYYILDRVV